MARKDLAHGGRMYRGCMLVQERPPEFWEGYKEFLYENGVTSDETD